MSESLKSRERALEEVFFAQQEATLIKRLRDEDRAKSQREAISATTGIQNAAVLDKLVALDVGPQTIAALGLVPLVLVAWADGKLEPVEGAAVRRAAGEIGLDGKPEALALLDHWLKAPPTPRLKEAWRGYVQEIAATMPAEMRATLARDMLARARGVAEAAGGFLGLGSRVSDAEAQVLAELEAAVAG